MKIGLFLLLLSLLTGCSSIPKPTTYKFTTQQHMQAAHHWEGLAQKVVNDTEQVFKSSPFPPDPIYVENSDKSTFGKAFHTYLVNELIKRGFRVSNSEQNALKIDWGAQIVIHQAHRNKPIWPGENTLAGGAAWAGMAAGLSASSNDTDYQIARAATNSAGAFLLGAGILTDLYAMSDPGPLSQSEILITTALMRKDDIIGRNDILSLNTRTFYVNDYDRFHYSNRLLIFDQKEPLVVKTFTTVDY